MVGSLAFVVYHSSVNAIESIAPISERVVVLKITGIAPLTLINNYSPTAEAPETQKEFHFTSLKNTMAEYSGQGPTLVQGALTPGYKRG